MTSPVAAIPAPKPSRWIEQLPVARDRPVVGSVAMLAIVAAAWLLREITDPLLPPGFPYVTFFPAVIVTSFLFGVGLGSVSALLCGLLAWYFFIAAAGFGLTSGTVFALVFYVFVVATDLALVHWMQTANRQLAAEREVNRSLADTRELLFRELQHRVSNNLQVAAGLLTMQKRQLTDAGEKTALDEAAGRLALIGRISRQGTVKPTWQLSIRRFGDRRFRRLSYADRAVSVAILLGVFQDQLTFACQSAGKRGRNSPPSRCVPLL